MKQIIFWPVFKFLAPEPFFIAVLHGITLGSIPCQFFGRLRNTWAKLWAPFPSPSWCWTTSRNSFSAPPRRSSGAEYDPFSSDLSVWKSQLDSIVLFSYSFDTLIWYPLIWGQLHCWEIHQLERVSCPGRLHQDINDTACAVDAQVPAMPNFETNCL